MDHLYKPTGYPSVSAYIMANGGQPVIDFLKKTFDATEHRRAESPDGSIAHVEIRIDDSIIMLSDGSEGYPGFPVWIHVYVPDVDATYRRAIEAGGISVQEPVRKGDVDRRSGVKDPAGNTWWIATQEG